MSLHVSLRAGVTYQNCVCTVTKQFRTVNASSGIVSPDAKQASLNNGHTAILISASPTKKTLPFDFQLLTVCFVLWRNSKNVLKCLSLSWAKNDFLHFPRGGCKKQLSQLIITLIEQLKISSVSQFYFALLYLKRRF